MKTMAGFASRVVQLGAFWLVVGSTLDAGVYQSQWLNRTERYWAGPEFWTNPLQDWRVRSGRLECWRSGGDRNAYLLTRELRSGRGSLTTTVTVGRLDSDVSSDGTGWVGFKLGSQGEFRDYRDSAVRGHGLNAGMRTNGQLFIGNFTDSSEAVTQALVQVTLRLQVEPLGQRYRVSITALDGNRQVLARHARHDIHPDWLIGQTALVCSAREPVPSDLTAGRFVASDPALHSDPAVPSRAGADAAGGNVRFWFRDWRLEGSKVAVYPDRAWGPVLWTQYTLSNRVLKLTAQMAPVGNDCRTAQLQARRADSAGWETIREALIDPLARTATFHVSDWDDSLDTAFRVVYPMAGSDGTPTAYDYQGTIRQDPKDKPDIVVAAFTGNNDFGFPHADVVRAVSWHRPDLLVFTGDQIYERVGDYGVQRTGDVEIATLDYLRKWYMMGWEYRELLRDIPTVFLPDDHDVYQGNIWGAGGRASSLGEDARIGQDAGGYCMPPVWVNMVQRTQCSHLPDPWDATPVEQGLSVYYCPLLVGGVSFAVIEDRKWKSSPTVQIPQARIRNGWAQNRSYDASRDGDVPGAVLLGRRQLDFLEQWAADWSGDIWMKAVVSQTLFANVATLPREDAMSGDITPRLRVLPPGEYAEGDVRVQDHDSNGWPQTGRNMALERMRRGFAVHITGDQHLGSTIRYGIDEWGDAGYAIGVPAVANIWPRRWFPPPSEGGNRRPGAPFYTGDFRDGFGNKITVHAVSNPHTVEAEPTWINQRAPGYGIIVFNREIRRITMSNWPRWVDPSAAGARPYPGWPITYIKWITMTARRLPICRP